MTFTATEPARSEHPVDVVERVASLKSWIFAREGDDEISITVTGGWTDYQISFTWLEDVEGLHLACAFDLKLNERRRPEVLNLISLINEQMWVGHFGLWEDEGVVLFRHTLLLTGGGPGSKPGVGVLVACRAQEPRPLSVDLPLPSPR